ncbi:carbonic anhydrase family protein [Kribbella sandramycini]|uniref:carbonic anhydrase n=1 Tax=Kribbella sandramycini TaxID=60450 RepID=A0A7Y4KWA3_9ACTN|nr:carbonic anhydrase family protein [Kribbella sandramycini]MBB6567637.1 carbonic anhydrase [Kribbella sandramycini]NOL39760.1 carbonic anhydrase family protein [Kribbella sandramycini]
MSGLTRRSVLLAVPAAAAALAAPSVMTRATAAVAHQSPIDIHRGSAVFSPGLPALHVHYPRSIDLEIRYESKDGGQPGGCETRTAEETVLAEIPKGAAWVTLGGVRYDLANFHFHTRSEHRFDGHQYPLEQHFVHLGPNGERLVIGLFITTGGHGGTLQDQALATVPDECGEDIALHGANLAGALPTDLSTYRYDGSLTTTPFSEPVSWLVLSHIREIKSSSLAHFQTRFPNGDSRALQPLNGRTVRYRPQH